MKRAKIAELKNNLSRYLEHVRAGGTVMIMNRDRPVAKIVPIDRATHPAKEDPRIEELVRLGLARRGKGGDMRAWLRKYRPVKLPGRSMVEEFLEERRSGW